MLVFSGHVKKVLLQVGLLLIRPTETMRKSAVYSDFNDVANCHSVLSARF